MLFTISLIEWYHWYSDIENTLLNFEHVELRNIPDTVRKCQENEAYQNRVKNRRYITILIEPEVD